MLGLYIVWQDDYEVGIPIIDEQHRGIVALINTFYHFVKMGRGEDALEPTFISLTQYARTHFSTEEQFMARVDYPRREEHRRLHEDLARKTESTLTLSLAGEDEVEQTLKFLKEWWLGHILGEDRDFGRFFRERGDS